MIVPESKKCNDCKQVKPLTEFYKAKAKLAYAKDGLMRLCKNCSKLRSSSFREAHPEWDRNNAAKDYQKHKEKRLATQKEKYKIDPSRHKEQSRVSRLKKFGLSIEAFAQLAVQQEGKCALCGTIPQNRNLDVDHSHKTGKVRALLCNSCNRGLGHFKENIEVLTKAINYLREYAS